MSLYNYVGSPNNNLICCICRNPFTDPSTTVTCAHTFCRECILRALSHAPICPVDRSPLTEADLVPANPIVQSLVEELEVECIHRSSGCKHTCQRQLLHVHLRDECLHTQAKRKEQGCGKVIMKGQVETHSREKHGVMSGGGDAENMRDDLSNTESGSTVSTSTSIPSTSTSTSTPDTQMCDRDNQQQRTIDLLTEQNLLLRHRVEVLEGAMQVMKKEMGTVRNVLGPWFRNSPLPSRTQMPNQTVRRSSYEQVRPQGGTNGVDVDGNSEGAVRREDGREEENHRERVHEYGDDTARVNGNGESSSAAMGRIPTVMEEQQGESIGGTSSQMRSPAPAQTQRQPTTAFVNAHGAGHRPSLSLPGDMGGNTATGPSAGIATTTDRLASYFPTLREFDPLYGNGSLQAQHYGYGFGYGGGLSGLGQHHQQYPVSPGMGMGVFGSTGGGGGIQNSQAVVRVPPLQLGTSLVGTLEGLRESVLGVAEGLTSVGRKGDFALANESLRLSEEIVSMRAAVHGLRMQVHALMMERNAIGIGREDNTVSGGGLGVGSPGGWMGMNVAMGVNGQAGPGVPPMPPRMYPYAGPSITKL